MVSPTQGVSLGAALSRTFESLQVPNYRKFFAGQIVNWTGQWVQWIAQAWLVLELTGSGFGLGLITALQWLPVLLFGAWAGVLADRFEKRKLLIITNITSGGLSLLLGILTVSGVVTLWMVIAVALLLGLATAIDNPARQTFTLEMVGRSRITNAVSLNTATFTTARVLGPAIAGFMIDSIGIGECFLVNAVSCIPVVLALVTMRKDELHKGVPTEQKRGQVREGLRYIRSVPVLSTLLLMMALIGTLEYNWQVILPVLARETFAGDAKTLGILGSVLGIGMFIGSMTNAAFGRPERRVLIGAGFVLGATTLLLALAPNVLIAGALMIPLGASSMAFLATMNSTLQLNAADHMRGRVMALYFVLFLGSTPVGAPIVGWIAESFDPRAALAVGGVATILGCIYGLVKLPPLMHVEEKEPAPAEEPMEEPV